MMSWRKLCLSIAALSTALALASARPAAADDAAFKVGTDPDYRPISFADPSGKLIGFDPDFAASLAEHMGAQLHYEGVAWDGIIAALQAGKIDAITNMVISAKRKETVAFSQPFLAQTITTVVRANEPNLNPTPADLKSMKVGVMVNTSAAAVLAKIPGVAPVTYNTVADEYTDLMLGRIDVIAIESINGSYTVSATYPGKLRVTGVPLSEESAEIGVAMRKDNSALVEKVNKAIDAMRADGSLDRIATKWFGDTRIIAKP
jgi:ABC-type amino acid transport substrate-binding protein